MTAPGRMDEHPWRQVAADDDPELAALRGREIGPSHRLEPYLGRANHVGSRAFRVDLVAQHDAWPVVTGLRNRGPHPAMNWIEVGWYASRTADGAVDLRQAGLETPLFAALASCIPPGGHLMVEYESPQHRETERGLVAGVPPVATPLGLLLNTVGAGDWIRDWYIPEGWSEGPRKLQGFRALNEEHRRRRGAEMVAQLEHFLRSEDDDPLLRAARGRARPVLAQLTDRA